MSCHRRIALSLTGPVVLFLYAFLSAASAQELSASGSEPRFYIPSLANAHAELYGRVDPEYIARPWKNDSGVTEIILQRDGGYAHSAGETLHATGDSVALYADGFVRFEGISNPKRRGYHTGRIDPRQFQRLVQYIIELRFMDLAPTYAFSATDSVSTFTSLVVGGERKIVENYGGGGPATLLAIETLIDDAVSKVVWDEPPSLEDDVLPEFIRALESGDKTTRMAMIAYIRDLDDKAMPAMSALARALNDSDAEVRLAAAKALGRIGRVARTSDRDWPQVSSVLPSLVDKLTGEDPLLRAASAYAILIIGGDVGDEVSKLIRLLDDEDSRVRSAAAGALRYQTSNSEAAIQALLPLLGDSDEHVQGVVIDVLSWIVPDSAELYEFLDELIERERFESQTPSRLRIPTLYPTVLRAIGRREPKEAVNVDFLVTGLENSESSVRMEAVDALGSVGPEASEAIGALIIALRDERVYVSSGALRALRKIVLEPDEVAAFLTPLVREKHVLNALALDALAEIAPKSEAAFSELTRAAQHSDPEIQGKAMRALGSLGEVARPALGLIVEMLSDESGTVRVNAASAAPNVAPDSPEIVDPLIHLLTDEFWYVRNGAAYSVARLDPVPERAMPQLARLLSDENENVRKAAAWAMEKIFTPVN